MTDVTKMTDEELEQVSERAPYSPAGMAAKWELTQRKAARGDKAAQAQVERVRSGKPPTLAEIRETLKRARGGK